MEVRTSFVISLVLFAAWPSLMTPANAREVAEEISTEAVARLQQLEAEVAALRSQGHGDVGGPGGACGCAPACCESTCCDCCSPCHCPSGWYAGGELIWMEPHFKGFNAVTLNVFGAPASTTIFAHEYDYEETGRFWAGYTGCNGLGLRASWWEFDHDADTLAVTPPGGGPFAIAQGIFFAVFPGNTLVSNQSLELETLDFEATSAFDACGGSIVAGFGLRYAKFDVATQQQFVDAAGALILSGSLSDSFEGFGPTLSVEFYRPLYFCGWSLYSNLRGTLAFGEEQRVGEVSGLLASSFFFREADEPLAIAELQIALQWCNGCWFARGGWQAQYWDDVATDQAFFGFGVPTSNIASDIGLQGFFVAAGAQF